MRHSFLIAVIFLALAAFDHAQTSKKPEVSELENLRNEFISATKEYVASLEKLKASYERGVARAEERLAQTRELFSQHLVSSKDVEASERAVAEAKRKVAEVDDRIAYGNKQIKELPTVAELEREARKTRRTTRRAAGYCSNWTLTASRRETKRGVTLAWKLVCAR